MIRARWLRICTFVLLLCMAAGARADDAASEDEALVQRGIELRRAGDNAQALALFEQALALHSTPRTQAQVALAQQALGHWLEAERGLEQALSFNEDAWIVRYQGVLADALVAVRSHLAWLTVEVAAEGAELNVNGASAPTGQPVRVVAGDVSLEARAPGHESATRTIQVAPEAQASELIRLLASASPPAQPELLTPPEHQPGVPDRFRGHPSPVKLSVAPVVVRQDSEHSRSRLWGSISLGASAALAAGGIVAYRVRDHEVRIWNDNDRCLRGTRTRGEQCAGHAQAARAALASEIVAFSAAGAAAGVGVWLLMRNRAAKPKRIACAPYGGLGLSCLGRF